MTPARTIAFLFAGGSWLSLLAGCKATACPDTVGADGGVEKHDDCVQLQPTIEYQDKTPRTAVAAWASGVPISISNQNGEITVAANSTAPGEVQVSAVGFTRDTHDDTGRQNATNVLTKMPNPTVTGDPAGVFVAAPGGGVNGYHLIVQIPASFDGAISITSGNGTVTLTGAASGKSTIIKNDNGDVTATNLTGSINLTTGNGNLTVSATPSGTGNVLATDLGDINATIGMTNLTITATAQSGAVAFPAAWTSSMISTDNSTGTATIGDGSGTLSATANNGNVLFQ